MAGGTTDTKGWIFFILGDDGRGKPSTWQPWWVTFVHVGAGWCYCVRTVGVQPHSHQFTPILMLAKLRTDKQCACTTTRSKPRGMKPTLPRTLPHSSTKLQGLCVHCKIEADQQNHSAFFSQEYAGAAVSTCSQASTTLVHTQSPMCV